MFGLIPREEAFFDLFKNAAHNMIEGSRLLKDMMEDFRNPTEKAKRIKDVEHIGDGITHEIARKLNLTFITPIDREDIHDLASALDDILDVVEAIADRFILYKVPAPSEPAIRLANVLYQASVEVGATVDLLGKSHPAVIECSVVSLSNGLSDRDLTSDATTRHERICLLRMRASAIDSP